MNTNAPDDALTISDDDVIHLFQIVRRADRIYDPTVGQSVPAALYAAFNQYKTESVVQLEDEPRFFAILGQVASDDHRTGSLLDRLKTALQEQRISIELGALEDFSQDGVVEGVSQYIIEDDDTNSPNSLAAPSSPHATSTPDNELISEPAFGDTTSTSNSRQPPADTVDEDESMNLVLRPRPSNMQRELKGKTAAAVPELSISEAIAWAEECYTRRRRTYARRCLQTWHDRTWSIQRVEDRARAHDGYVLLRQSMDMLKTSFTKLRQKRYSLLHYAKRVDRINRLLVKDKAFSHWIRTTTMGRDKTSLARRHITRYRCFGSWLSLTLANELLQQSFVRRSFLKRWQHRWLAREQDGVRAIACHQDAVMRRYFRTWALAAREKRVSHTLLWNQRNRIFYHWVAAAKERRSTVASRIDVHENSRRDHLFRLWLQRTQERQNMDQTADQWRRRRLLSGAFTALKRTALHRVAFLEAVASSNRRLAKTVLAVFHLRATQEAQAAEFYRQRKLRVVWQRFLAAIISRIFPVRLDWRFAAEALYKWRMAYYIRLTQRSSQSKLRQRAFVAWAVRTEERRTEEQVLTQIFEERKRSIWVRGCFNRLRGATQALRENDEVAGLLNARRLSRTALATWPSQAESLKKMREMARLAEFFILAKHAFQGLERGFAQSRERRRDEASRLVSDRVRTWLLRESLGRWGARVAVLEDSKLQAEAHYEQRTSRVAATAMAVWADRTRSLVEQNERAVARQRQRLLKETLHAFAVQHERFQGLQMHADAFRLEMDALTTTTYLRKLNWRVFQLRRNHDTAMALFDRNSEKRMRNILRYWAERTAGRPLASASSRRTPAQGARRTNTPARRTIVPGRRSTLLTTPARSSQPSSTLADFSLFDSSVFRIRDLDLHLDTFGRDHVADPPSDPVPDLPPALPPVDHRNPLPPALPGLTPGYLRTPSRRAAARAMTRERLEQSVRVATTTEPPQSAVRADPVGQRTPAVRGEETPFITPFERKLQAGGYQSGLRSARAGVGTPRKEKGAVSFADFDDVLGS